MQDRTRRQKRFYERYGPWAVVTGASSGIGREIALRLAESGLNLILAARSKAALDQLVADLASRHGIETRVVALDLSRETGVETLGSATSDLDVGLLIAAAGFGTSGPFLDSMIDQELEMLNVNCRSVMALSRHFGRRFAKRGRGGMVLMSSIENAERCPLRSDQGLCAGSR